MLEYFSNHLGVLNGGNNFHPAAAFDASLNIDIEDSSQQPCPGEVLLFQLELLWLAVVFRLANVF